MGQDSVPPLLGGAEAGALDVIIQRHTDILGVVVGPKTTLTVLWLVMTCPWGPTLILLLSSSACCQALYVCPTVSPRARPHSTANFAERSSMYTTGPQKLSSPLNAVLDPLSLALRPPSSSSSS